jgi:hypothetical protein
VAGADPVNAKGATHVRAICGSQTIDVVVNGQGEFTPAHDIASTSVFIPTAFNLTFTFTPTGGSPEAETDTAAKAGPGKGTVICTMPLQTLFAGPEGTATIQGTVTGFWTPKQNESSQGAGERSLACGLFPVPSPCWHDPGSSGSANSAGAARPLQGGPSRTRWKKDE